MVLSDILEVALISGIIFFILGYKAKSLNLLRSNRIHRQFLSPQYLKHQGYLLGGIPSTEVKKK